jgi:hypothetical protein
MNKNHLKLVMLCWSFLIMATIWIDNWFVSLTFGELTCALGVVILITTSAFIERDQKKARNLGLLLMVTGILFTLVETYDGLITGNL